MLNRTVKQDVSYKRSSQIRLPPFGRWIKHTASLRGGSWCVRKAGGGDGADGLIQEGQVNGHPQNVALWVLTPSMFVLFILFKGHWLVLLLL